MCAKPYQLSYALPLFRARAPQSLTCVCVLSCGACQLDYDRCSELSDSVGYWYVEDLKDGWCRVYYSTDSQLPRFVPGYLKDMLTSMAAKRSTSWVDTRCNELTGQGGGGGKVGGPIPKLLKKAMMLLLLAGAWQKREAIQEAIPFDLPFVGGAGE